LLAGELAGLSPELARRVRQAAREQPFDGLLERVGEVLDAEAGRWLEKLAGAPLDGSPARRLREVAARLERARVAAKLAVDPVPPPAPVAGESEPGPVPAAQPDPDLAVAVEEGAE
jgi:hypothetical protein